MWSQFATSSCVVRSLFGALTCYRSGEEPVGMNETAKTEQLDPLIIEIRGHRVVIDADLARLYE